MPNNEGWEFYSRSGEPGRYFEEYYPNFEFAQSISRLNPERFSGVVYDPGTGRAIFAPRNRGKFVPYTEEEALEMGEIPGIGGYYPSEHLPPGVSQKQEISPEEILQQQMTLGRKRIEEDYEMEYNTHRNEYAADDINFITLAKDAPQYADQFTRQRDVAAAVFQKKTAGALTDRDLALLKLKRQGEDVRNLWSIIDKKKNEITPENALKAKTDAIKMGGFAVPTEVFEDSPSVEQEAIREIQKRAMIFPYLMEEDRLRREARGDNFSITEKKDIEKTIDEKIKAAPATWSSYIPIPGFEWRKTSGMQKVFNEMLGMLPPWETMTSAQKKWFLSKFNFIAKTSNSDWEDITFEGMEVEMAKREKK